MNTKIIGKIEKNKEIGKVYFLAESNLYNSVNGTAHTKPKNGEREDDKTRKNTEIAAVKKDIILRKTRLKRKTPSKSKNNKKIEIIPVKFGLLKFKVKDSQDESDAHSLEKPNIKVNRNKIVTVIEMIEVKIKTTFLKFPK